MNRPYIKQYDATGDLINPIISKFLNTSPNRRERRESTINRPKLFSNKKGVQLVVTKIAWAKYMKYKKVFQNVGKKRIIHFVEA